MPKTYMLIIFVLIIYFIFALFVNVNKSDTLRFVAISSLFSAIGLVRPILYKKTIS